MAARRNRWPYLDSAYGTGDLRGAIADAGHQAVIKPKPLQAPVKGGFTIDDFAVDERAGTVTCPGQANHGRLSRTRIATFGARCRDCPLRAQCTTCKTGRKLVLHPRDELLRAARADWAAGSGLRADYMAHRPNVERAVAQVATFRGRLVSSLPRGGQEPRLAQAPHRRAEPAHPDREGPGLARRRLGAGHLTSPRDGIRLAAGTSQASRQAARARTPPVRARPGPRKHQPALRTPSR